MRSTTRRAVLVSTCLIALVALQGGDCNMGGMTNNNQDAFQRVTLNIVKIDTASTTTRGPAVGDGVLAFNAQSGAILAFLKVGETQPQEVTLPSGLDNDDTHFAFSGKKLVGKDRTSGRMWVFDTETEESGTPPHASINLGTNDSVNAWDVDGKWLATINATVTSQDGANRRIKLIDITDLNNLTVTPFTTDPDQEPEAVAVDESAGKVAVRGGDSFYIYDIASPDATPNKWTLSVLQGGFGSGTRIELQGGVVALFDENDLFSIFNITTGVRDQPARNPARPGRGLDLKEGRFVYFANQTESDGSTISVVNRAIAGQASDLSTLIDPAEIFVNDEDATDGVVGFGATCAISPNGKWTFVAGETAVGVAEQDRLFLSTEGGDFKAVADPDDDLNVLRAAGVAASDNVVGFLIPPADNSLGAVRVGYAELPPP